MYPQAHVVGASSSGNILGTEVSSSRMVATAVHFEKSSVVVVTADIKSEDNLEDVTQDLVKKLPSENLKHIFVLSDGLNINGSVLVRGLNKTAQGVSITGGMAGDGDRFQQTWVIADGSARQNRVAAVGFYGDALIVSSGCHGGWTPFGTERLITRSDGNILYELDGRPALDLYKEYLGEYAKDLPNSGMRFPLAIREHENDSGIVRTLLAIDEESKSIVFAGDMPQGYFARLMKPDIDLLIDGAGNAAAEINNCNSDPALGLVVSCVGRKIVMQQLVEEELDSIADKLGNHVQLTGFYSYGEIAPFQHDLTHCELHNQTMTITGIFEK
jgi:hypothetical protein